MAGAPAPFPSSATAPGIVPAEAGNASRGPAQAERCRIALEYAIAGDLRFLSHHDELRMLTRALVRAQWPLAYTRGFNPRPRLTLALPRNLGTASVCQVALVALREPRPPTELYDGLAAALPAGCRLRRILTRLPSGTPHAQGVTYEVELDPADVARVVPRITELCAQASVVVAREGGPEKPTRPFEIRPYITKLELEGGVLRMTLRVTQQGSARPSEVLTALGLAAEQYNYQLRRAGVQWDMELAGPPGSATHERKPLEQENQQEDSEGPVQAGH